jgi:hypothetical protein
MQRIAETGGPGLFAEPLQYTAGRLDCMELARVPHLHPKAKSVLIYSRMDTLCYILRISASTSSKKGVKAVPDMIVKIFSLRKRHTRPPQATRELLEDHEVEVRYLKLLTTLLAARGCMDMVTMVLGMCEASREDIEAFFPPDTVLFEERKRSTGRYAIILAESCDMSATSLITRLLREKSLEPQEKAYQLASMSFQVLFLLTAVQKLFPSFRHNDLHSSNILIQTVPVEELRASMKLPASEPLVVEYALGAGYRWQVNLDRAPFRVLMWDLSYASISAEDGERSGIGRIVPRVRECGGVVSVCKTTRNQYVDMHQFFDSARYVATRSVSPKVYGALSSEMRSLLEKDIVPPDLRCAHLKSPAEGNKLATQNVRLRVHDPEEVRRLPTPEYVLTNHALFKQLFELPANRPRPKSVYRFACDFS